MDTRQVAAVLEEIGTLLELKGEIVFKARAYHNVARTLKGLEGDLADLIKTGELAEVPGIGKGTLEKIATLVETGRLPYYEELKASIPPGLVEMLRISGMGPKKVKAVHEELGITGVGELAYACRENRLRDLAGFGQKTQENILAGIEFLSQYSDRSLMAEALPMAEVILDTVGRQKGVIRSAIAGSLRRRKETIGDVDILVSAKKAEPIMEAFVEMPEVQRVAAHGKTKSSVVLVAGMNADLRVVEDESFPFALAYFTGSKEHNIRMRQIAQKKGLKLNEYGLFDKQDRPVACKDEDAIFTALDLAPVPPELREDTGEIEAAAAGKLPELVELQDLKGTFHNHTDASDGAATLAQMAAATQAMGLEYLGIADHSQSAFYAGGLKPAAVRKQHKAIDALNRKLDGLRVFKGIESDILPDGSLDYDDKLLATFDYVVASVHSHFKMPKDAMTKRIIRALEHPATTMLGHPTGRLLLSREGYELDLPAVIKRAGELGKMIEINAHPMRLDLDWRHCKMAREHGVRIVINPDAHHPDGLADIRYGIDVARRGWLTAEDVFNTRSVGDVLKALA